MKPKIELETCEDCNKEEFCVEVVSEDETIFLCECCLQFYFEGK